MNDKDIRHLIQKLKDNIEFSYNGDLGKLQHVTKENIRTAQAYLGCNVITEQEAIEIIETIKKYYYDELQKEINRGYIY